MTQLQDIGAPQLGRPEEAALQSYERSLLRSHLSLTRQDRPDRFALAGLDWDLHPEVFAPVYSPSTAVALALLDLNREPLRPRSDSFLEIGTGSGVIAVMAALAGSPRVVATDVNPRAVENAAVNAERHAVNDRLRTVHSDLFSEIGESERFDTVFWSSNYVLGPDTYEYKSVHERAYVDTGYRTHRRFVEQAPRWVTPGGSALLHFSDRGDLPALHRIADDCGRELRTLRSVRVREGEYGEDMVEHMLIEIVPAAV
ncbi:class I SAM-dependent methyltransferase [Streptomyces sp. C10-9-1]|uniref:50S ribosomal protein L11 methyltransferase n=1 Tax=Streptomyces sp. C10-9-1 TaxID=1859285 RepID=UPI002113371C|nr:class I SAM-dependent methyltransferase [Streptomyces sp. C10-9-1]MCQ6552340.1 class I SAM-dependent methyltransferase [Streptomyces sp. C10-9-1]